ncbi:site-2 protease family protein [candidate division FCPU426 bacterium]|nr:site-2 protease family protein [candidate division FCPU426 bacterium]
MDYFIIIVIIGSLILVHELGHYAAGRLLKIPMAVFSVGFGPALLSWRAGETEYRLSWFPLGGYVLPAIATEADYNNIPVWRRVLFSMGGPAANWFLALVFFAAWNSLYKGGGWIYLLAEPWRQTLAQTLQIASAVPALFHSPGSLSGVVGIVAQGTVFIGRDLGQALRFAIIISLNLCVLNLLPIPGLDGGKIVLSLLEKIQPAAIRWQASLTLAGMLLLLGLMLYVTFLDLQRLLS